MIGAARSQVKGVPQIGVPFAPIPHEIIQRRDIGPLAKLVFAVIANNARMRRDDASPMTNAEIAQAVGATVAAVRRALDELEKAGLIDRQFGASERVRESIRVSFVPTQVARPCATPAPRVEQPGCALTSQGVARGEQPLLGKNGEEREKGVSTSSGEKAPADPKPSPAEIADAMRAMVAGRYSPIMFGSPEPQPGGPEIPPDPTPKPPTPPTPNPTPPKPPTRGTTAAPSLAAMCRRVGYSAVAAVQRSRPPRKTAAEQIAELRRWSAMREGSASASVSLESNPNFAAARQRNCEGLGTEALPHDAQPHPTGLERFGEAGTDGPASDRSAPVSQPRSVRRRHVSRP